MEDSNKLASNLLSLLHGREAEPSEFLRQCLDSAGDINKSIGVQVSDMSKMVQTHLIESCTIGTTDGVTLRINTVKKLYFRLLDLLLSKEMNAREPFDCRTLLNKDLFHKILFACSVEIVNFAFQSTLVFPWVLDALHINAFQFYKIIEVVIRADDCLSRDIIKHLKSIEVMILEKLAWVKDSPLWKLLLDSNRSPPMCEDVMREPLIFDKNDSGSTVRPSSLACQTPIKLRQLNSPIIYNTQRTIIPLSVKKNLNNALDGNTKNSQQVTSQTNVSKISDPVSNSQIPGSSNEVLKKVEKSGSVFLFFRKFYMLSFERLRLLCELVNIDDTIKLQKIWTLYQMCLCKHPVLFVDRHLDQILMCSIYVICKLLKEDVSFSNLLSLYRCRLSGSKSVYCSVVLGSEKDLREIITDEKESVPGVGDLIQFYNKVFLHTIQGLVNIFSKEEGEMRVALSPLLGNLSSPHESPRRRVSDSHALFVRPLEAGKSPRLSDSPLTRSFRFTHSPIKPLIVDDSSVTNISPLGKRLLCDETEIVPGLTSSQRLRDLIKERTCYSSKKQKLSSFSQKC